MSNLDKLKEMLGSNVDVAEVQVEYHNGDTKDYSLDGEESREDAINNMFKEVDWEQVEEVELEYADGSKSEFDLEEEEEDGEEDDDEDEDDDDDDDEDDDDDDDKDEDDDDDDDDKDED
ncbi:hypothetical protein Back11_24330 [Paenibacillus baekrokdamisoli]|uniref:Uncharacterized protein n=1 Tax=Paenibacillus baekrokdamisoli TaxID=1712516 RepID=A0A3G9JB65_9BACL|nr:hypothetical protein [Paenibacillus baekrokdamisoli]MBB3070075.1 ABC-type Zn2+ transport system substrate-binding protein/surface adhesin [Paenibacillus baekrokdamisoli]BBH21088.1 hypothetical protein Back11_24330 [Paenibacillus baekrokdamisoli]